MSMNGLYWRIYAKRERPVDAAKKLGISPTMLSFVANKKVKPSLDLKRRIEALYGKGACQ